MGKFLNKYANPDGVTAAINAGRHREIVGGLWDQIGNHQFAFLKQMGMCPGHRILDVGCGCLRVGIHLANYLEPGHYFGIDLSEELITVGYDVELTERGLCHKVPRANLHASDRFDASSFGEQFDMLFAQSVFTHLPMNHRKLALTQLAKVTAVGGRFYATSFLVPDCADWTVPQLIPSVDLHSYPDRDPFQYTSADIGHCAANSSWNYRVIGDWGHARGQAMVEFTKFGA